MQRHTLQHLIFTISLLFFSSTLYAAEDCQTAILENLDPSDGHLTAQKIGSNELENLHDNDLVEQGTLLTTDESTTADLRLCEGTVIRLGAKTQYRMDEVGSNQGITDWLFSLLSGSARALVSPSVPPGIVKFRLQTPSASVGVRGTEFLLEHSSNGNSQLYTVDGEVLMGGRDQVDALKNANQRSAFQSVSKGMSSSLLAGQTHPSVAKPFDASILQRHPLFHHSLQIRRSNFQRRVESARERKQASPLFQKTRPALQQHLEEGARVKRPRRRQKLPKPRIKPEAGS